MLKTIGVLGALPEEVDLIVNALEHREEEQYGGVRYYKGTRAGKHLVVCCAGMGKVNAAAATQVLITRFGADAVIFSGIAGNMCTEIGVGDVVIGKTVLYHDADNRMLCQSSPGTAEYTADPLLVDAVQHGCELTGVRYIIGRIATGDQFIGDSDTKKRIQQQFAPDCVEMEGAAVGHVAMRNHVPFVVLRTMSDECEQSAEELGGEDFDISTYVETASAIVVAAVDALAVMEKDR